jgi:hypothetical protein
MNKKTKWNWKINLRCGICQEKDEDYYRGNPLGNSKPCDTMLIERNGKLIADLICEDCFNKMMEGKKDA